MVQLLVGAVSFGAAFSYFATNVNMNPKPHHLLKNKNPLSLEHTLKACNYLGLDRYILYLPDKKLTEYPAGQVRQTPDIRFNPSNQPGFILVIIFSYGSLQPNCDDL